MHVCKLALYHISAARHGLVKQESPKLVAMLMTSMTKHLPEVQAW